jgi:hypothetical protein
MISASITAGSGMPTGWKTAVGLVDSGTLDWPVGTVPAPGEIVEPALTHCGVSSAAWPPRFAAAAGRPVLMQSLWSPGSLDMHTLAVGAFCEQALGPIDDDFAGTECAASVTIFLGDCVRRTGRASRRGLRDIVVELLGRYCGVFDWYCASASGDVATGAVVADAVAGDGIGWSRAGDTSASFFAITSFPGTAGNI